MSVNGFVVIVCCLIAFPYEAQSGRYGCPSNLANTGCTCVSAFSATDYTYKTTVTCTVSGTAKTLKDNLQKLNGFEIDDFILRNIPFARLPEDVFTDKTVIRRIILENSQTLVGFGNQNSGKTFLTNIGPGLTGFVLSNVPAIRDEEYDSLAKALSDSSTPATQSTLKVGGRATGPTIKNFIIYKNTDFSDNNLDTFKALTTLERVVWRATGITTFNADLGVFVTLSLLDLSETPNLKVFKPTNLPPTLTNIYLSGTSIVVLGAEVVTAVSTSIDFIDLSKNVKLSCDCEDIQDIVTNSELADKFDGSTCGTPASLKGKPYGTVCQEGSRLVYSLRGPYKSLSYKSSKTRK